jgi:capsular polysaccharide biosynthesis protein
MAGVTFGPSPDGGLKASDLRFYDATTWEELGPVPCRAEIPDEAWKYGAVSEPIDFAAIGHDVWVYAVVRVTATTLGFCVISEDGSSILSDEIEVKRCPNLRPALIRVSPAAGTGRLLLRNYGDDGAAGAVDIDSLRIMDADDARALRLASVLTVFQPDYYEPQRPDTDFTRTDPLAHFIDVGAAEGADPNPYFHSLWYAEKYPDQAASGLTPIEFYLTWGGMRGDDPSLHFKGQWYLDQDPTLQDSRETPLANFLKWGKILVRVPNWYDDHFVVEDLGREGEIVPPAAWAAQLQPQETEAQTSPVIFPLHEAYAHAVAHGGVLWPRGPDFTPQSVDHPPVPYLARLRDVVITGGGSLMVTLQGEALHDELAFADRCFASDSKTDFLDRVCGHRVILRGTNRHTPLIAAGIHLMNEADANYFHWLCEVLPRLFLMQEEGLLETVAPTAPYLISEGLHPNLMEALGYLEAGDRPVRSLKRDRLYRVAELFYPGALTRVLNNYYQPAGPSNTTLPVALLSRMVAAIKARIGLSEQKPWRRVYLHREGLRTMANQGQLEEVLAAQGFEILDLAGLSTKAQIGLFSQCAQVVAATGAAVTNIMWCQPGARIAVLYPKHPASNFGIWQALADVAGAHIDHVECPRTYDLIGRFGLHDNYSFPMDQLPRLL